MAAAVLLGLAVTQISLDRFPLWDEGVFLSQTAGLDGADAPAVSLVPSREIGSIWKAGALTRLTSDYANLRLLNIALTVAAVALVAKSVEEVTKLPRTVVALVLGSYWLTFLYLGQFLRFALLAFVLIGALARYALLVRSDQPQRVDAVILGALFGLALVLGPFETGIILLCTLFHWVVTKRAWRSPVPFFVTLGTISAVSLVVYYFDTRARYGSLAGRLEALAARSGPMSRSVFDWSLVDDYARLAFVEPVKNVNYAPESMLSQVAFVVSGALILIGFLGVLHALAQVVWRSERRDTFATLLAFGFVALMLFLAGFYDQMDDRYFILPGSLLLLLGLLRTRDVLRIIAARFRKEPEQLRRAKTAVALVGLLGFVVPNVVAGGEVDANLSGSGFSTAALTLTRMATNGEECRGVSRYNIPAVQWATGCRMSSTDSVDAAIDTASTIDDGMMFFVYWSSDAVGPELLAQLRDEGWTTLLTYPGPNEPEQRILIRPPTDSNSTS